MKLGQPSTRSSDDLMGRADSPFRLLSIEEQKGKERKPLLPQQPPRVQFSLGLGLQLRCGLISSCLRVPHKWGAKATFEKINKLLLQKAFLLFLFLDNMEQEEEVAYKCFQEKKES